MGENKRKHLDMIQAIITRMASNSFIMKGWSVTAGSGLIAIAAGTKHQWVAVVALLPSFAFWALDAYYLSLERRYRALFDEVARMPEDANGSGVAWPYSLDSSPYAPNHSWWTAVRTVSVCAIPIVMMVSVVAVYSVIAMLPDTKSKATPLRIQDTLIVRVLPQLLSPPGGLPKGTP